LVERARVSPEADAREKGRRMVAPVSASVAAPDRSAIPTALFNVCFVLFIINASFFPTAWFSHWWIYDPNGRGIPTDFVNVWAAGKLALGGHPAQAWDWDIQRQIELALLKQDFPGYFACTIRRRFCSWHRCWRGCPMPRLSWAGLSSASFPISS
jgi:hypothetical protein